MLVKYSAVGLPPCADLSQFVGNTDNRVGDVVFSVNDPAVREADVWIVSESCDPADKECLAGRVVFVAAETMWTSGREAESPARQRYLQQFDTIYTYEDLYWPNVRFAPPFLPWMINANHGPSILSPHHRDVNALSCFSGHDKPCLLSVVCSTKTYTPGHRLRLRFVEALASELGDQLTWFGNGRLPVPEKWDAIAPYRFHLAIENQSAYGVFTEKLYDAFLGLSHPIYYGAPDIDRYFPGGSVTSINIADFTGSVEIIKSTLAAGLDSGQRVALTQARDSVLTTWNLFHRLAELAHTEFGQSSRTATTQLELPPRDVPRWRLAGSRLRSTLRRGRN